MVEAQLDGVSHAVFMCIITFELCFRVWWFCNAFFFFNVVISACEHKVTSNLVGSKDIWCVLVSETFLFLPCEVPVDCSFTQDGSLYICMCGDCLHHIDGGMK